MGIQKGNERKRAAVLRHVNGPPRFAIPKNVQTTISLRPRRMDLGQGITRIHDRLSRSPEEGTRATDTKPVPPTLSSTVSNRKRSSERRKQNGESAFHFLVV